MTSPRKGREENQMYFGDIDDSIKKMILDNDDDNYPRQDVNVSYPTYSAPPKLVYGGLFFFNHDPYKQLSAENKENEMEASPVRAHIIAPEVCKQLIFTTDATPSTASSSSTFRKVEPPGLGASAIGTEIDQSTDVFWLAKDHYGCRLLQKQLETNGNQFAVSIFEKIIDQFYELMIDPFGNYFCQKLLDYCDVVQTERITSRIRDHIYAIALNLHGTRALQRLIECPLSHQSKAIIRQSLGREVVTLIQNANGNHVVQKVLTKFESMFTDFVYDELVVKFSVVATNKHGCCVIQRALDFGTKEQIKRIVDSVVYNLSELVQDQFGNYVVQYVIEMKGYDHQKSQIGQQLLPDSLELAKQKFASNVIEKCILHDFANFRTHFAQRLQKGDVIVPLLLDKFANYVVQRCISLVSEKEQSAILVVIKSHNSYLCQDDFGQKIVAKLFKQYQGFGPEASNKGSGMKKKGQSNASGKSDLELAKTQSETKASGVKGKNARNALQNGKEMNMTYDNFPTLDLAPTHSWGY